MGMIPCEESSARKQRLGHISKQGNSLLRFFLVEAAACSIPTGGAATCTWRCVDTKALPR